ncbi:unnamed protein product [Closterium sp. NIES-65]|nr:unnamed protein product [Closterium sp. NIES-65]
MSMSQSQQLAKPAAAVAESYLSSIWSFWKRRRRAILITLGVVGVGVGSYVVYQRLHARLLEDQQRIQRQQQQILEEAIREAEEKRRAEEEREDAQIRAHFESIQRIADATTLPSVLPHLRTQLFSSINLTALTDALFSSRQHAASATAGGGGGGGGEGVAAAPRAPLSAQEKLRIWEDLKVLSFCRTLCGMWSLALLSLFVRAQLNVLGRRVFLDAAVRSASSSSLQDPQQQAWRKRQLPMRCQHQFIALADYLPQIGLRALTRDAQAFIAPILERLSLRDNISLPQLLSLIHDIRLEFEARDCTTWQRYLLPPDNYLPADLAATSLAADASAGRGAPGQGLGGMGDGAGGARMGGGGGMEDEEEQALLGELMDELRHVLSSYEFQEALSASLDALTEAAHEHLAAAFPSAPPQTSPSPCDTWDGGIFCCNSRRRSKRTAQTVDASQTAVPAWPQKDAGPYGSSKAPARPDVAPVPSSYPTAVLPLGVPGDSALAVFSYNDLRAATEGFRSDNRLGEGGFGIVYKGWVCMRPGARPEEVAVKVLNHEGLQGHKEWLAEVNFLGQVYHPHLVRLIGYCAEAEQRLLVYEFMCNGSLEVHLFRQHLTVLPWSTRMKIALGAARGLAYLHEEATRPIIYRDFKTSNILLTEDFSAKLSDFGLAKDGPESGKTHVSTRVMGTYGYAAPEYVMTGHLTLKSDVYSYGVVLLEMITGRRSMDKSFPPEEHSLVDWARPFLSDRRKVFRLLDSRLDGMYSVKGAQHAMALAQSCLNRDPKARPVMSDAVKILEALQDLDDMAPPRRPLPSSSEEPYGEDALSAADVTGSTAEDAATFSVNDADFSDGYGASNAGNNSGNSSYSGYTSFYSRSSSTIGSSSSGYRGTSAFNGGSSSGSDGEEGYSDSDSLLESSAELGEYRKRLTDILLATDVGSWQERIALLRKGIHSSQGPALSELAFRRSRFHRTPAPSPAPSPSSASSAALSQGALMAIGKHRRVEGES